MTDHTTAPPSDLERVSTGSAGLDAILRGGLPRGGLYLIEGRPGTGKTILAGQVCFAHLAAGGRALYVTLLTESHSRMLAQLRTLAFYDAAAVGESLYFLSATRPLEAEGPRGVLDLVRQVIRERGATLLVIDGVAAVREAATGLEFKRFLQDVQALLESTGATGLLLAAPVGGAVAPEQTMADGIITLHDRQFGAYDELQLEVVKCRATAYLRGRHSVEITAAGLVVHPRTEVRYAARPAPPPAAEAQLGFGAPGLDALLGGGPRAGSVTVALGSPGTGKTNLGLQFLAAGVRAGERGLHFGAYEAPPRLLAEAGRLGLDLGDAANRGLLELVWRPALGVSLDALAEELLAAVARHRPARTVVDGLDAFGHAALEQERLPRFLAALFQQLRGHGVTTLALREQQEFFGPAAPIPLNGAAELADNVVFLRTAELHGRLRRFVAVLKLGEGNPDPAIRELRFTGAGIDVAGGFGNAEAILTGMARLPASGDAATTDAGTVPRGGSHAADDPGRG
ncbi:MAG: hypothetical protein AVDCRST_MAG88-3458 [uncultured Thermomicrobiales bacterium]|uniref:non-specific serine/threonine protein kinase n=1 Tax=uncultured Thermomicrobiales bacterium TaxID=1645740 RepID=A0A6J4VSM5_9BACT|nr:MAG: hypothetical protein AVDCRST_MAG88-3458 [uncultured Thermomicrobiales bacterium]